MMARAIFLLLVLLSGVCRIAAQIQCRYSRDEAAAGRVCQRACSADGTCRKQNRECECDGRCGPSCLKKTCPLPEQPINGSFIIRPDGRFIGSEAIYSCDVGYVLVGNASRTCQTDKTWSGTDPACNKSAEPVEPTSLPAVCERLPAPLNGIVTFSQESEGAVAEDTVATFECNHGYSRTSGNLRRNCQPDGSWSGNDVVCSADVPCLRNDQEIQNQNRQCLRQCESDGDCHRDRRCVCDDICGLACIRIDRANHCDHLSSDQRVRVRITPNNRTFGSIARYECRVRHEKMSGSNERRCLGSGQWSGRLLNCIPIDRCDQPPEIENSAHNGTKDYYIEGEIVMYSCHNGYYRSGYLPLSRCNGNEWSEIQFQCSPKSCGDPGHVLNGLRHGASFSFRGSVEYTCNLGYELRGLPRRYCQADQQWSGYLPTCHAVRCPAPGVLDNGRKIGSDFSYNEIVSFECNTRYLLRGQRSLRCQANGTWDAPQPTCTLIQCPRPADPENGQSDVNFQSYGYQGTIRYTCNSGYALRGSRVITCNENEEWSPPPPLCLGQCRIPPCPTHGRWTISNSQRYNENCPNYRFVDSGTRLTYRCNTGYFKCQQRDPVCQDLEWDSNVRSLCKPLGCDSVTPRDRQLQISYTVVEETQCVHERYHQRGTVIHYSCNIGYKIRDGDPRQTRCNVRSWSPQQQPTCEEVTCPSIRITNGGVSYQQNGHFTLLRGHNAVARFFCRQGYMLDGRNSAVCDNGIWNDTIARCMEEPCSVTYLSRYDLEVVYRVPPSSGVIEEGFKPAGTSANFICTERGYEASETKICQLGGWTGPDPECSRVPCDDERLVNGDVSYNLDSVEVQSPVHGVVRNFGCNAGFITNVNEPSQCDAGIWTRALPVCNEKPCNKNDLPSGDWEIEFDYPVGMNEAAWLLKPPRTVARFTCNVTGYVIADDDTNTCRLGQWHGPNPSCERRTCQSIQLDDGRLEYWDIDNTLTNEPRHGDTRIAHCENGYILRGRSETRCWDGEWEDGLPTCEEKSCNTNDILSSDWEIEFYYPGRRNEAAGLLKTPRTVARFTCNVTGYVIADEDTKTCRLGQWHGPNPSCERRTCRSIQLDDGRLEYRDIDYRLTTEPRHGDTRVADCGNGYNLRGRSETRCWDGEWEDELPTCEEESCNTNDILSSDWEIEFDYPGGRNEAEGLMKPPGTVATFTCNVTGYVIAYDDTKTCRLGEWDGLDPSCVRRRCQTSQLENGQFEYHDIDNFIPRHGDYRTATCQDGYNLQGTSQARCLEGEWDAGQPTCQENPCSLLSEDVPDYLLVTYATRDGRHITLAEGLVPSKGVATFRCREEGLTIRGDSTRKCKKGQWRGAFPECVNAFCSIETIDNGNVTRMDGSRFTQEASHRDFRRFTCEQGYTLVGERRSQCLSGVWDPEKPSCEEARCQAVENNGEYARIYYQGTTSTELSFPANTLLEVECAEGGVAEGPVTSVCRRGLWDPPRVLCVQYASCEAVENNGEYALIYYQGTTSTELSFPANTFLEVECAEGRVAEGPTTSVCRRGLWDPPRAKCVQYASCEEVAEEEGRTIVYTDNSESQKQHNSGLDVTCENHMARFGHDTSTCFNGTWVPPAAHCKENLALGKSARQDSTEHGGVAGRAVDGSTNGTYFTGNSCTHTSKNTGSRWWYVDLGSAVLVQEIIIYNRQEGDHHLRLLNARVRVGEYTGIDVTENHPAGTINETEINPIRIEVNPAIEGTIVSISELARANPLTLCEVQVFGELRGSACSNGCQVPHLENGYFTLESSGTSRLQTMACISSSLYVYSKCESGMYLWGSHVYTCQSSGEWLKSNGRDSTCHLCPETQCLVPYIENGQYRYSRGGYPLINGTCTHRNYLYVVCDNGLQLNGIDVYYCIEGELRTRNPGNIFSTCTRGTSNEREQQCSSPRVFNLVNTFVGSEYSPLDDQETFRGGDFITSRCQDPKTQKLHGSVTRRCEGGQWSGDPAECVSTTFAISVGNTALQNVTENGTLIVYPIRGYVTIQCKLRNGETGIISIYKDDAVMSSFRVGRARTEKRSTINNPSPSNSGTYRCEMGGASHSIVILFKAISCPPPEEPDNGLWRHNHAGANPNGDLGYIFMETLSLICLGGYPLNHSTRPTCSYHGTWINMSQRCIRHPGP